MAPSWWASTGQLALAPTQDYHSYTHTLLGVAKMKVSWVLATLLPPGGNPPTYGDLFRGKTRDGPLGHLGRPPEPKPSGVATPQVSSVVQVPGKAKAESDDCPKIQALRARLKQKYGDTFFSGKPVFPPPVRGPYGEAKIRLKQDPRVYRHREFALRGERKEAMEKILRDFIQRGWLEPCHSEWASPCFVVPKKVAGEWRLVRCLSPRSPVPAQP